MSSSRFPVYFDSIRFLQILLLIGVISIFVYVVWAVFVGSRVSDFKGRLKKRMYAITILLEEKKDVVIAMCDYFTSHGIELTPNQETSLSCLRFLPVTALKDTDVKSVEGVIKDVVVLVRYLATTHPELASSEAFITLDHSLDDIDKNYRQVIAVYNTDVAGYNYWIKNGATRWIFFLFGNRRKNTIA